MLKGHSISPTTGPILESNTIFQKEPKKRARKGNIFENLRRNVQNLKIFQKRTVSCVRISHG